MTNKTIKKIVAGVSIIAMMPWLALADTLSDASTATLTITADAAGLVVNAPASLTLTGSGSTVAITANNVSANDSTFDVSDLRGTLAGWSASMSSTNLVRTGTAIDVSGTSPTSRMGMSGAYNCTVAPASSNGGGEYRVTITTGGALDGTAKFDWKKVDGTTGGTGVTAAASVLLDSGISATFTGSQTLNDVVALRVSCASPLASQVQTVSDLTAVNTSRTDNLSIQNTGATFASERIVLVAEGGAGNGEYTFTQTLTDTIRKNSMAGAHTSTLTFTII